MAKITRNDFNHLMRNKSLDVAKAEQDPKLAGVNLKAADLNTDGQIDGLAETDKLFLEVDKMDRDGSVQSMDMGNAPVMSALNAVADGAGADGLKAHMLRINPTIPASGATNDDVLKAADFIVTNHTQHYGVQDPWFNLDSNHALPANVRLGGLTGRWKCNLFAGNVMAKAGFKPPYYGNKGKGEYPNANQFYKWSDKHAAQYNNPTHFKMRAELMNVDQIDSASGKREDAVREVLMKAKPGDFIFVDHTGSQVSDGGHCRVVIENTMKADGTGHIKCAQASQSQAEVQDEKVFEFTGEEHIWVMEATKQ